MCWELLLALLAQFNISTSISNLGVSTKCFVQHPTKRVIPNPTSDCFGLFWEHLRNLLSNYFNDSTSNRCFWTTSNLTAPPWTTRLTSVYRTFGAVNFTYGLTCGTTCSTNSWLWALHVIASFLAATQWLATLRKVWSYTVGKNFLYRSCINKIFKSISTSGRRIKSIIILSLLGAYSAISHQEGYE